MRVRETQVTREDVTLAVREYGDPDAATHLLLLHGYPDDQTMWEPLVAQLPASWHVVTMDNRGAGRSTRPSGTAAYAVAELVEDVVAVIEAVLPAGEPVHLAGHDWGGVIGWQVVADATWDPRLERVASYTAVSGVCLDHVRTLASRWRTRRRLLPQAAHSWYILLFCVPRVPELLWRRGQRLLRLLLRRVDPTARLLPWGPALAADAVSGLGLYRAVVRSSRRPAHWRTSVPVQVVHPRRDGFVTPRVDEGLEARCRRLSRVTLETGHWAPRSEPARLAELVRAHVAAAAAAG